MFKLWSSWIFFFTTHVTYTYDIHQFIFLRKWEFITNLQAFRTNLLIAFAFKSQNFCSIDSLFKISFITQLMYVFLSVKRFCRKGIPSEHRASVSFLCGHTDILLYCMYILSIKEILVHGTMCILWELSTCRSKLYSEKGDILGQIQSFYMFEWKPKVLQSSMI